MPQVAPRHVPIGPPPVVALVPIEHCSDTGEGFEEWLIAFRERAVAQGISRRLATSALANLDYDPAVIELERSGRKKFPSKRSPLRT
jgi:membrane-bound lytic murein transglycosylase B